MTTMACKISHRDKNPTGKNYLLELMFAKFATAVNREKLNPLKPNANRRYMPVQNTNRST